MRHPHLDPDAEPCLGISVARGSAGDGFLHRGAGDRGASGVHRELRGVSWPSAWRGGFGPPLVGSSFLNVWGSTTAGALFDRVRSTMPPGAEDSLGTAVYLDIVAYLLQANGHLAGADALRADAATAIDPAVDVAADSHGAPSAADGRLGAPSAGPVTLVNRAVPSFTPVTDELLRDPPGHEWLSWRRTLDGHGYSPLDQITPANVDELRLAWVWTGRVQTTPLVHDGVLYLANPGNVLQALDAKTGDIIWQYRREYLDGRRSNLMRTIALYQDKVFMTGQGSLCGRRRRPIRQTGSLTPPARPSRAA